MARAHKGLLDRIRGMLGDDIAHDRDLLDREIRDMEAERVQMTAMIADLRAMDGYSNAWDQAADVLQQGITELEQEIELTRTELNTIRDTSDNGDWDKGNAAARSKNDGRDYSAEIAAAAAVLEGLRAEAEALIATPLTSEDVRNEVVQGLADIGQRLSSLYFSIPVSDYEANPIPEGRALSDEVTDMQVWLDEQWSDISVAPLIDDGTAPTLHSIVDSLERAA